jgi:hypothetical protein
MANLGISAVGASSNVSSILFYGTQLEVSVMSFQLCIRNIAYFFFGMCCLSLPVNAQVTDDFSYGHADGEVLWEGNSQYNSKWEGGGTQQSLFSFAATGGNPDGAGRLNMAVAERDYLLRNRNGGDGSTNGVTAPVGIGNSITLSGDFQIAITGAPLASGPDGTDVSLIGLQFATTGNWWDGHPRLDFRIARRSDSTWGVRFGQGLATIMGSEPNAAIGLGDGTSASTSGWFTMAMTLTDNGAGYDATASVLYGGSPVWTSPAAIATEYALGTPMFGGFTTGFNDRPELDLDGSPMSVGDLGKVSTALVDNFFLGVETGSVVPEPASAFLLVTGLVLAAMRPRTKGDISIQA